MKDLRPRELLAVVPLIVLIIGVGVYPKPVLDIINPAVSATMAQVHETDPVPPHPGPGYATTSLLTNAGQKGSAP
jgi:NADH-quinone oxidoreductase subunit M